MTGGARIHVDQESRNDAGLRRARPSARHWHEAAHHDGLKLPRSGHACWSLGCLGRMQLGPAIAEPCLEPG